MLITHSYLPYPAARLRCAYGAEEAFSRTSPRHLSSTPLRACGWPAFQSEVRTYTVFGVWLTVAKVGKFFPVGIEMGVQIGGHCALQRKSCDFH